jgi:hypothetical protein
MFWRNIVPFISSGSSDTLKCKYQTTWHHIQEYLVVSLLAVFTSDAQCKITTRLLSHSLHSIKNSGRSRQEIEKEMGTQKRLRRMV